ncbi:MAG: phosphatidylglycerophosphatase A [Alphaproteobacteria bacterium]|nr:phosphatidylglycerophosphatase A [Alphaproteobacteria bacterium]
MDFSEITLDKVKPVFEIPEGIDRKAPYVWIATWGGAGFLSPAPGTWGSIAGLVCGIIVYLLGGAYGLIAGFIFVTTLGLWAAQEFDKASGGHDSKMIVIDEVAGQWIAMIPAGLNPFLLILSLLLFRLFDILKPFPVSYYDRKVEGSAGVMGDDLVAGILAAVCLMGVRLVFF